MDRKWPKAVIFDMDGLMFASEQMIQRSWDEVGPELGYEPLGYHIFQTMGMNRASREQYFLGVYGEGFPYERFQDAYREKVRGYADREGVPVQKGLKSLLAYLKEEGIPMMVATGSSRAHALNYLERTGVLGYFRFVLAGDQVQVVLKRSMGLKAVWLSYVVPLFILMILILSLSSVNVHELYVGLVSIGAVALYYLVIYLLQGRLAKDFVFYIKDMPQQ